MATKHRIPVPVAMTIAGSDSGGGAGIQADLKTFAALGVFGTSAITCVTAQNPDAVKGVFTIRPEMVALQIETVCAGFLIAAVKTGMLFTAPIIHAVADTPAFRKIPLLVVDPVMMASSGARLLQTEAINALCARLLPRATVITPNLHEAEVLCLHSIPSLAVMTEAAREIGERFHTACVIKGGHLPGNTVTDILYHDGKIHRFPSPRVKAAETHGTGCAFSAALTAFLARGESLPKAVQRAKLFVQQALKQARQVGRHYPLSLQPRRP